MGTNAEIAGAGALRRKIAQAFVVRAVLRTCAFALPVLGGAVLAVRLAAPGLSRLVVLCGAGGVFLFSLVASIAFSLRRLPSARACVAAVDAASRAGGLMMEGEAAAVAGWTCPARGIVPKVRCHVAGLAVPAVLFALFAAFAVLAPGSFFRRDAALIPNKGLEELLEKEAERLEEYEAQEIVEPGKAEEIREWLEAGRDGAKSAGEMLEVMDHVAEALDQAVEDAATQAVEANNAALATEALAELLSEEIEQNTLNEADLARAAEMMRELMGASGLSPETISNLLASATPVKLTKDMLDNLLDALESCKAGNGDRLRMLTEEDVKNLTQCGGCCTNGASALALLVAQNSAQGACASELASMCAGANSSGGIGKGYAPAELTWKDPTVETGAGFKDMGVSPGRLSGDGGLRLEGVSASAPKAQGASMVAPGALEVGAGKSAGNTRTPLVLPRHREAVRTYFGN